MTPELVQRIGVGIILIVLACLALWAGGIATWAFATVAALVMMGEWAGLTNADAEGRTGQMMLCLPLGIVSPFAAGPTPIALGAAVVAALILLAITRKPSFSAGILYIAVPISALLWLRYQPDGLLLAFWGLSSVWATDIGAYFSGRAIGGPKIAPTISPNKTWAGLAGGMLGALGLGWMLMRFAGLDPFLALSSPLLAVLAQAGDFYESWLKRRAGVKDSGTLLPGHGGVLDRLDGVVTSLPIAALLVMLGMAA